MSRSDDGSTNLDAAAPLRRDDAAASPGAVMRKLKREVARLEAALLEQSLQAVKEREAERESLARELHDKFGQYLTVMEMELVALGEQRNDAPSARIRLHKLKNLTAEARQDMANMAWQMRPGSLQGLDLEAACVRLTEEWSERSGLSFDLHLSLGTRQLQAVVQTTLYRVLQEALTNIAKHANASRVGVILRTESGQALLIVEDDGGGFVLKDSDRDIVPFATLGFRGIHERLLLVSGTLEIETAPGCGTTLIVRVPL